MSIEWSRDHPGIRKEVRPITMRRLRNAVAAALDRDQLTGLALFYDDVEPLWCCWYWTEIPTPDRTAGEPGRAAIGSFAAPTSAGAVEGARAMCERMWAQVMTQQGGATGTNESPPEPW